MRSPVPPPDDRAELLAALQLGIVRTLDLARQLEADPLVGAEARAFLARLQCIQAEVSVAAALRDRRRSAEGERIAASGIWQ